MKLDGKLELLAVLAFAANSTVAADVRILSAAAVKGPLSETAAAFERDTGNRVVLEFTTAGKVDERLAAGERVDMVVSARSRLDALVAKGERAGAVQDLGTVRVGVAVRASAPKPDVSNVDAFRAALVAAKSVAYTNPAAGGTAGSHFAAVIDRLGVAEALATKRILAADGLDVMRKIQSGEAELGITQVSEILLVDRATYAGPLPESLQLRTIYAVLVPESADPAARALAAALATDTGRARFRAAGFD
jgi:molybdate transport system substrate-binding protein